MTHWAAPYIDACYFEVGMCWGLVQICCRERFGEEMPHAQDEATIRRFVMWGGWHRVPGLVPVADDIVVMMGPEGRHVGFAIHDGGQVLVMHAHGTPLRGGRVRLDTLSELADAGHSQFEFWRRKDAAGSR